MNQVALEEQTKERTVIYVTLRELDSLFAYGIDVLPCCHKWVTDQSIQQALDEGLEETELAPAHPDELHRAARTATFVRMLDSSRDLLDNGKPFFKAYAEMYFRGTAIRFKMIDMNTRWRAMQFRKLVNQKIEIHVFGTEQRLLREMLPLECFISN